jgi:amidase
MVPLALGADGMGSIRIPAACCGIVGIKPGAGVVPSRLGISSWFGMAENGALATTVQDAALMLSVLADRPEFRAIDIPARPMRIAVSTRVPLPGVRVDREIEAAVAATAEALKGKGHHVERADPPRPSPRAVISILAHWFAGAAEEARGLDETMLERRTRTHARPGRVVERLGLRRAQDRATWQALHEPFFRRFDLLITPVLAALPPRAEWSRRSWTATMWTETRFAPFPASWNFAGYPAASIPAGMHSTGMPLSVQLVASAGGEQTILAVASQLETLRPWPRHAPVRI